MQEPNGDRFSTLVRSQFFPGTADERRLVSDGRKHAAEEEQTAGFYGLDIGAERSGRRREFDAELLQSALRVGRLRPLAAYHFPECAPPSTCSTSPVT